MGLSSNPVSPLLLLLLTTIFLLPTTTHLQSTEEGFISVLISQKGLNFAKDLLMKRIISSHTPLPLPKIQKSLKIPFLGCVDILLSDLMVYRKNVPSSYVKTGERGVGVVVSGASVYLSTNWWFSYKNWRFLFEISSNGNVSMQVDGMEMGVIIGLENQEGVLNLSLLECSCYLKDLSLSLNGLASWFYQRLVHIFKWQIRSVVEKAITKKIEEEISKLNFKLQALPKEISMKGVVAINVTVANGPLLSDDTIGFEINGLFTAAHKGFVLKYYYRNSQPSYFCKDEQKMLEMSLDEAVFNSGSVAYFNAGLMQWVVDKVPEKSLLNTSSWRYILPHLYMKYPDADMNLNFSLSAPPIMRISSGHNINTTVYADITINVLDANKTIPVACISLVSCASGSVKIKGNNLGGRITMDAFKLFLKWSDIGNFHMYLIQSVVQTILQTVLLPYVNFLLREGFSLSIHHGFSLRNADVLYTNSSIVICSDIAYVDPNARFLVQSI